MPMLEIGLRERILPTSASSASLLNTVVADDGDVEVVVVVVVPVLVTS